MTHVLPGLVKQVRVRSAALLLTTGLLVPPGNLSAQSVAHPEGAFSGFLAETRAISTPANALSIPPLSEWDAVPVLLLGMGSFAALGLAGGLIIDAADPCNCVLSLTAVAAGVGLVWATFYLLPPVKEWSKGPRVAFGGVVGALGGALCLVA